MITLLEAILTCASILLVLPVIVLLVEVLFAVFFRSGQGLKEARRPTIAVLVPAHNEAGVIASTIRSILPQLSATDRLLVVADNCSDETAAVAAAEGAQVTARFDANRLGKGYALDFGVRHLHTEMPEVVVVIDADCHPATGAIDRLARLCALSARPVQALYLMRAPIESSLHTRVAQFAWVVKNQVRPLGLHRLSLPCHLMGTGMAFPWSYIVKARLATSEIVEDLALGIDCVRAGIPALFCPEALVTSTFPTSPDGIRAQRTRWEHGHLGMMLREVPRLLFESVANANPRLGALALDLSVPPLALLALLVSPVWLASALLYISTEASLPVTLSTATALMLMIAVFLSWVRYGRNTLSLTDLAYSVVYSVAKIPLYAKFLISRQTAWVRTKRDANKPK